MAEKTRELVPVQVTYTCDTCGEGEMKPTGTVYFNNPLQYPHECTNCGTKQTFRNSYPYIRYEERK